MAIKDRIKEARLNKKYTQEQLATLIGVAKSTVTGYEKGNSEPSIETISKIMSVLDVDANFLWQDEMDFSMKISYLEMEHIEKYRDLDDHGHDIVDAVLDKEHERVKKYGKLSENNKIITLMEIQSRRDPALFLPYWENGVSAGNGIYQLNDTASVMLSLWATELTKQADFIIKVIGSSMEPDFHDGDKVLVNRKVNVEVGEVGIFVKNGETYIKELGDGELISKNTEYPNIQVNDYDNVVCLGKVIGTLRDEMIVKD